MIKKGDKINYLTILDDNKIKVNNKTYYFCKCDCGNTKNINSQSLILKRIRDCGCGQFMLNKYVGEKRGKLSVVSCFRKRIRERINIMVNCKCDCGSEKTKTMPYSEFKKGLVLSCGCIYNFDFNKKYKGKIYNEIEILEVNKNNNKNIAKCKCKCGNVFFTNLYNITSQYKYITSCNKCSNNGYFKWKETYDRPRLKRIYNGMIRRCYNSNIKDSKWYKEKGIIVCEDWKTSFESFYNWAIENGYKNGLTIDRIDTRGNYEPNNCRWVNMELQQNNRINNVRFFVDGKNLTIKEISKIYGINQNTLRSRLFITKMTIEEAITIPIKKRR